MNDILVNLVSNICNFVLTAALAYGWHKYTQLKDKVENDNAAIRAGLQSLLRDRMIQAYNHFYEDKGYMPIYARESFIANYNSYHNLGENGVMDNIKDKMLKLPTSPPEEGEHNDRKD